MIYNTNFIDIQLFANNDEKTEKPTPRRRTKARQEGQVFQSQEIQSAIVIIVAFITLKLTAGSMFENLKDFTTKVFSQYITNAQLLSQGNLWVFIDEIILLIMKIIAPILIAVLVCGLAVSYAQIGFLFTTKPLIPKLSHLNPINGFKRMFSARALMQLVKSIVKIIVVGYIAYVYIKAQQYNIINLINMQIPQIIKCISDIMINVVFRMGLALIILAIFDYIFEWKQYEKSLKMTKEEIKQEYKETEGDPKVKSKRKEKQRQMAFSRMMREIPKADVVITNPTHFAVALKYDLQISAAPFVLAKGQDYVALRIKKIAKENSIEIVENKKVARAIYFSTDVGESIPPELYQAVAEILAFVYSLNNN